MISNDLAVIESGQSQTYEEPFDTRSGQRVFLCTKAPLRDEDGNVIGIVGVAKDITVRKSGEHEAENARKELAHRSKNSLAIVHALARKTLNRGDRVEQFEARLLAYARSQDLLTRSPTNRSRLRDLVDDSRLAFAVTDRFKCEGPDVVLDPRVATQVSIALHELATNSIKYGALASDGTIEVCWEIAPIDDARTELTLRWEERSPGTLGQPSHRGFGHDVLTTIVPAELSGTASLKFDHHGLCWTLQTQIDRLD